MHRNLRTVKKTKRKSIDTSTSFLLERPRKKQKLSIEIINDLPPTNQKFINHSSQLYKTKHYPHYFNDKKNIHSKSTSNQWNIKQLERKLSPKSVRNRYEFSENYTASLALPVTRQELHHYRNNIPALLYLSAENITKHAALRVDLFFYTLVAYWNQQVDTLQAWTKLQHGRGRKDFFRKPVTEGCHSSLIPALVDDTIKEKIPIFTVEGYPLSIKNSLVCATHFMDSLNTTFELPKFVNAFDDELEVTYRCREKSLAIIQAVSAGKINPMMGLHRFLLMMQKTFIDMQEDKQFSMTNIFECNNSQIEAIFKRNLLDLVIKGTLKNKLIEPIQMLNNHYVALLLRLTPEEIAFAKKNSRNHDFIFHRKMFEIQKEIIETPSAHAVSLRF